MLCVGIAVGVSGAVVVSVCVGISVGVVISDGEAGVEVGVDVCWREEGVTHRTGLEVASPAAPRPVGQLLWSADNVATQGALERR